MGHFFYTVHVMQLACVLNVEWPYCKGKDNFTAHLVHTSIEDKCFGNIYQCNLHCVFGGVLRKNFQLCKRQHINKTQCSD